MSHSPPSEATAKQRPEARVAVIGAGMSGVLAAIEFKRAGYTDLVIYEKGASVGGTWRENTYPGICCDVPSHFYSYSFELNPEWSHRFSPGAEIRDYFEGIARRYEILPLIQFETEVQGCRFDHGRWHLALADGTTDTADFVIAATGVLHQPALPDLKGLDSFAGPAFHSARWDHNVAIEGRRLGVVGTGSSAVQIVSATVDSVQTLNLFQRTPQWITPIDNPAYQDEERAEFRKNPEAMQAIREEAAQAFTDGFANHLVDAESPVLAIIHDSCVANLESSVRDPILREKLRPDYQATCKRLVMSEGFYEAIQRPNANLITAPIDQVEPEGIRTSDGELHRLDILVLATGFRVEDFVRPMQVSGRGGTLLDEVWEGGPKAYLSICVPDFPNFFMLQGPSSPVGNFSLIEVAELQEQYILDLNQSLDTEGPQAISVSRDAAARYEADRQKAAQKTVWASGCNSWYIGKDGLPIAWPFTFDRFREEMEAPRLQDFETQPIHSANRMKE